ncbi:imelysin family protein [uncultured Maribacter sp.]|uniref:imelysin family protein n=1 Tax=uncultured Maribacter sp. TaxID=431308 RepID=UPI002610BEA3|nr:imelysin family protein [uncultured Maribacter sp.]
MEDFKRETTATNFDKIKRQWLVSSIAFAKTNAYNLVPVKEGFYHTNIYNYPINTALIENNIAENVIYDTDYLHTKSTVTKGLGALEYLIYNNQDSIKALVLLQEDEYRLDYMLGVTKEILRQVNLLIAFWEENYKENFINSKDLSCTENARCLAFNQIINLLDVIRVTKIGKPAGLESSENTNINLLQAFRSKKTLHIIKSSIEEIEYVYTKSSINFSEIVDDISGSNQISNEIANSFKEIYSTIDGLNIGLYDAISNNDKKVESLYISLSKLIRFFSVDVASMLSVSVLPTDNDGD